MGLKRRSGDFTGTLKTAILRALKPGQKLGKRELLGVLRGDPKLSVSVRRVSLVLSKLIGEGRVVMEGARANATFRRK